MQDCTDVIVVNDHGFINGGQSKVAIESAKGLASAGVRVTFFAACGPIDGTLESAGVKVLCLDQKDVLADSNRLAVAVRGIWNTTAAKALHSLLAEFDPATSIVHCHGFSKALSPAIGPTITRGPLRHVYTLHEYFLACPNGGFYDYQRNEICTRRALGVSCLTTNCDVRRPAHKAWRVARQAILWSAGNMPRGLRDVIYISETQKRVMQGYFGSHTRLHHVPNPVSLHNKPRVKAEDNDIFLFVGRLSPEKGGLLFAQATQKAGLKAVLVGEGSQREAIQDANPEAVITGWVTPPEVETWLEKSRCLVFPSLWYECQPLVPLEALARGVPVICGAWNAAAESVEDGITGVLLRDPSTLQDVISSTEEWVRSASREAYARSSERNAGMHQHVNRIIDVYNQVLSV
jgi:glycosyltransferase involved in cell wall biosynthesis